MHKLLNKHDVEKKKLVTMSGGNYGKAFAYSVRGTGLEAVCIMPETVPANRIQVIQVR